VGKKSEERGERLYVLRRKITVGVRRVCVLRFPIESKKGEKFSWVDS
jgi:hypothetical protein